MPTDDEIDQVLNRCAASADAGKSLYPGMTYEQGVDAGVRWATDETDENPFDEEDL